MYKFIVRNERVESYNAYLWDLLNFLFRVISKVMQQCLHDEVCNCTGFNHTFCRSNTLKHVHCTESQKVKITRNFYHFKGYYHQNYYQWHDPMRQWNISTCLYRLHISLFRIGVYWSGFNFHVFLNGHCFVLIPLLKRFMTIDILKENRGHVDKWHEDIGLILSLCFTKVQLFYILTMGEFIE